MITLTNTPNNLGILIKGDYNDLNSLYDSLANYVDFYIDNIIIDGSLSNLKIVLFIEHPPNKYYFISRYLDLFLTF